MGTAPVFDAHFHIIDPAFPMIANQGYVPDAFTTTKYLSRTGNLGVSGGAVVAGSFQGSTTEYLIDALQRLGSSYVGVVQLDPDATDDEIRRLDAAGVRATRFNLYRGTSVPLQEVDRLARRVHEVAGWHSEFYLDAATLPDLADLLGGLPQASIDHLGMTDDATGTLLDLVEGGLVVKATGLGRIHIQDPDTLMRQIVTANPTSLVFGSDLPSTRATTPFRDEDLDRILNAVGAEHAPAVAQTNAQRLYRQL